MCQSKHLTHRLANVVEEIILNQIQVVFRPWTKLLKTSLVPTPIDNPLDKIKFTKLNVILCKLIDIVFKRIYNKPINSFIGQSQMVKFTCTNMLQPQMT